MHAQRSLINWALFKPTEDKLVAIEWGHGGEDQIRHKLAARNKEVVYGLMRLSFDFNRKCKFVHFVWYETTLRFQSKSIQILSYVVIFL